MSFRYWKSQAISILSFDYNWRGIFTKRCCLLLLVVQSFCATGSAQIPSVSDTTSTPIPNAGHDYIHAPAETVNPANGSLSIRIGVQIPPSRGFTIPFNFAYDSSGALYVAAPAMQVGGFMWWDTITPLSQGGWSYSVPMLSVQDSPFSLQAMTPTGEEYSVTCNAWTNYVMQDATGTRWNLGLTMFDNTIGCNQQQTEDPEVASNQVGPILASTDPTWYSAATVNAVDVIDADGTDYSFGPLQAPSGPCYLSGAPSTCTGIGPATSITDRNGNGFLINGGAPIQPPNQPALTYTDTIGRTALNIPTFGGSPDTVTVSGLSQAYQVNWTTVTAHFPINMTYLNASLNPSNVCFSGGSFTGPQPSIKAVSSIVLPNGQQYTFSYVPAQNDPDQTIYGMVTRITYPTGGYVRYQWGLNSQAAYGSFPYYVAQPVIGADGSPTGQSYLVRDDGCAYYYDTPVIIHRYVSYDGTHEVEQQDFTYATSWNPPSTWGNGVAMGSWSQKQTTVVSNDLIRKNQYTTVYTYTPSYQEWQPNVGGFQGVIPVESQVQYSDFNGTPLKTIGKQWEDEGRVMKQQITTLAGMVSESDWNHDSNEMLTEEDDYDYGSGSRGPLLKKTIIPSYSSFDASKHIVDKPYIVQVMNGDGTTLVSQVTNTQYDPVGNLLSSSRYINTSGSTVAITSNTYDGYGNVISTTDPNGYVTRYSYTDAFVDSCSHTTPANAYLTGITYPTTTNGIPHTRSFQYHCASGSLANSTDENSQTTSYSYTDPTTGAPDLLNRLRQITYPPTADGTTGMSTARYTSYTPVDIPGSLSLTKKDLQNTAGAVVTQVTNYDGFGQVFNTQLLTPDVAGPVNVDTVYDGLGEVFTKSTPYRSKTDPTYGLTTYTYDALGRERVELDSDNINSLLWTYPGNTTNATDENGNTWVRTTDALGRLTGVVEPNSASTGYTYNAIGDLVKVQQGTLTRSFTYDLLSRLVCASNPENSSAQCPSSADTALPSGVVAYSYDLNGNVKTKTDARGVTIGYNYDALNRLISKQYSGGTFVTPSSCFLYDTGGGLTVPNSIGRLVQEWTQNGTCNAAAPASDKSTQRSILSYDALGRILTEQRCSLGNCKVSAVPFSKTNTYDLAGNLTTYDNGLGTLTITNSYDAAGRLFQVTSNVNDATHPQSLYYISNFTPFGAPQSSALGGNLSITQTYDARLRPTGLSAVPQ